MSQEPPINRSKRLQWRLECLGHSLIEALAGLLPGAWAFRLGESLGTLVWHCMPLRRKLVIRNLRIAYDGEKDLPELRRMAKQSFRRTAGNLISAAHTAKLTPAKLAKVIQIENLELLEQSLAGGRGVVLLLSHMGNWEVLSRFIHLFPPGTRTGAFYRPLNNRLLDQRVLDRRQADGTRMFSKRDPFHQVTGFLRAGGVVGVLADQRVGRQGEVVSFFGRHTRASPLPSLLARRAKSEVLALSVVASAPGKWKAVFIPVEKPATTENCMLALEQAMKAGPLDVFWLQERWKVYVHHKQSVQEWLGAESLGKKPLRALVWLANTNESAELPTAWLHPDVTYEVALKHGQKPPIWLPSATRIHEVSPTDDRNVLQKNIAAIDATAVLPLDFILSAVPCRTLLKAGRREAIPVIFLS